VPARFFRSCFLWALITWCSLWHISEPHPPDWTADARMWLSRAISHPDGSVFALNRLKSSLSAGVCRCESHRTVGLLAWSLPAKKPDFRTARRPFHTPLHLFGGLGEGMGDSLVHVYAQTRRDLRRPGCGQLTGSSAQPFSAEVRLTPTVRRSETGKGAQRPPLIVPALPGHKEKRGK
jgi:hypothetical protein